MKRAVKCLCLATVCFLIFMAGVSFGAQDVPALRAIKDNAEKARVQALIDKARGEGKIEAVGVFIEPNHFKYIMEKFKAYYGLPNLVSQFTYSNTSELITNVEQVLKAKRNSFDIVWTASWDWYNDLLARKLIMRYDSPMYKEYTLSSQAGYSKAGYWVSDAYSFTPMYNPKAMEKAGFKNWNPTSWSDFVDPKLRGLVSNNDVCQSVTAAQTLVGLRKVVGVEWIKKVGALKPALFMKTAQGREWVASGEYPLTLNSHAKNAEVVRKSGAPVVLVYPKEGVVLLPLAPIILTDAPRPNIAKLFIDYVRSAVGTDVISESGAYLFFGRPGVKSPVPDLLPPWEKLKVISMNWDVDGSEQALKDIQNVCMDAGLCK